MSSPSPPITTKLITVVPQGCEMKSLQHQSEGIVDVSLEESVVLEDLSSTIPVGAEPSISPTGDRQGCNLEQVCSTISGGAGRKDVSPSEGPESSKVGASDGEEDEVLDVGNSDAEFRMMSNEVMELNGNFKKKSRIKP